MHVDRPLQSAESCLDIRHAKVYATETIPSCLANLSKVERRDTY